MDSFVTWDILKDFATFLSILFMVVTFTKELPFVKKIPTKYWSAFISFVLLIIVNLHDGTFTYWNLIIYALSSIMISLTGNGLADFNKPKEL